MNLSDIKKKKPSGKIDWEARELEIQKVEPGRKEYMYWRTRDKQSVHLTKKQRFNSMKKLHPDWSIEQIKENYRLLYGEEYD